MHDVEGGGRLLHDFIDSIADTHGGTLTPTQTRPAPPSGPGPSRAFIRARTGGGPPTAGLPPPPDAPAPAPEGTDPLGRLLDELNADATRAATSPGTCGEALTVARLHRSGLCSVANGAPDSLIAALLQHHHGDYETVDEAAVPRYRQALVARGALAPSAPLEADNEPALRELLAILNAARAHEEPPRPPLRLHLVLPTPAGPRVRTLPVPGGEVHQDVAIWQRGPHGHEAITAHGGAWHAAPRTRDIVQAAVRHPLAVMSGVPVSGGAPAATPAGAGPRAHLAQRLGVQTLDQKMQAAIESARPNLAPPGEEARRLLKTLAARRIEDLTHAELERLLEAVRPDLAAIRSGVARDAARQSLLQRSVFLPLRVLHIATGEALTSPPGPGCAQPAPRGGQGNLGRPCVSLRGFQARGRARRGRRNGGAAVFATR